MIPANLTKHRSVASKSGRLQPPPQRPGVSPGLLKLGFRSKRPESPIELGLADLKTVGEQRHLEAQQTREEDARNHAASVTELRGQLSSLTADFATQLRTSVEALQGAQNQQLAQVMSSFDEVKQLLSCRHRDPSKRCRVDEASPP